ncbi:SchA/CurD-like domain-containing protein [Kitasatospora paracochleata]|uniref:Heme-degrading monooxygenase HmoA n=1 Tax=Kitasatospora paracochleata TaxID=58354 RepID=A0ABT1J7U1_9ACTN|nr:SchA/CurD-like domain-containing protein [Kitasatospora paracochleata]MCP2313509.1 heme-degrading monooxygenase HmoA [Kitasatospora paracochleata]
MTLLSESTADRPDTESARLRVILLLDVMDGAQERFLDAYEQLRYQVSAVPGHLSDQLCQSIEDPSRWLITSEWESAGPFLSWVDSPEHREMVKPLHGCVRDTRSLRFSVLRETAGRVAEDSSVRPLAPGQTLPGVPMAPRPGPDGVTRHALTFPVKPGSEAEVARILADYRPPNAQVDAATRLARTTLFMHGNRVVRTVEVVGDLVAALRHVAMQPEVRAVEEAINPYLEEARDLDDPLAARDFFMRAALPAVHHHARSAAPAGEVGRYAVNYPVRTGCGAAVAELLSRQDEQAVEDHASPLVRSTVFQREDRVVRLVDLTVEPERDPAAALGLAGPRASAVLARLVEIAPDHPLPSDDGLRHLLEACLMARITDRRAPGR